MTDLSKTLKSFVRDAGIDKDLTKCFSCHLYDDDDDDDDDDSAVYVYQLAAYIPTYIPCRQSQGKHE